MEITNIQSVEIVDIQPVAMNPETNTYSQTKNNTHLLIKIKIEYLKALPPTRGFIHSHDVLSMIIDQNLQLITITYPRLTQEAFLPITKIVRIADTPGMTMPEITTYPIPLLQKAQIINNQYQFTPLAKTLIKNAICL